MPTRKPSPSAPALHLSQVSIHRSSRILLQDISFTVPRGTTCAIIGPNGSGKSTLLRAILGYEFPTSGTLTVLGETLGQCELARLRERVRFVGSAGISSLGESRLDFPPTMDLQTIVSTGARGTLIHYEPLSPSEATRARSVLRSVGLKGRETVLWSHASAGERTRTLLARARYAPPTPPKSGTLLLLDEPTANLDPTAREEAVAAMSNPSRSATQLIVTHHVEELPPNTNMAILLKEGKILAAGPARTTLTSRLLSQTFDTPIALTHTAGRWRAWVKAKTRR